MDFSPKVFSVSLSTFLSNPFLGITLIESQPVFLRLKINFPYLIRPRFFIFLVFIFFWADVDKFRLTKGD